MGLDIKADRRERARIAALEKRKKLENLCELLHPGATCNPT